MAISHKVADFMAKASWIRKMFEQGGLLKAQYGADNVFDFSLGNPNLAPPECFYQALDAVVADRSPGHGYMSNAGLPDTRAAVASYLRDLHGVELTADHIVMTCGAGGALNIVFKTILDPGDEVIVPAPYFVEYDFYLDNFGGVCKPVPTTDTFALDLAAIEAAITPRTKAILINSPNNPTGRIYDRGSITALGDLLETCSVRRGSPIYLVSDEPYSKIVYDGATLPSLLQAYQHSMLVSSSSKDLSIPGERVGFVAVNPALDPAPQLIGGLIFSNRTLGFVNAPALMQRVVARVQGASVDISAYQRKRDRMHAIVTAAGFECIKPEGAFYLFPRAPIDDVDFAMQLQEERILVVPGSGFGTPGFFRIAYCVDDRVIEGAAEGFARAARRCGC